MSKKTTLLFVITLMVLIIGISAASATSIEDNSTSTATVDSPHSTTHAVSSDIVEVDHKTTEVSQAKKEIKTDNVTKEKTTKTTKKASKNLKKDTQTHIVTNKTYTNYFTNGSLNDNVTSGDTLDLQGNFISSQSFNYTMTINKPVNIVSTTHDSNISLNSTSTDFFGASYGNAFTILRNGSGSNITGIYFYNTQLYINNTENVTLNNITVINENQVIGGGIGVTSIRGNSSYITVKNSYFRTKDNGGHSTLVGAYVNHCIFDNNTIVGVGNIGNLVYLTTYNVDVPDYNHSNEYNVISNNRIYGPNTALAICYGIGIAGSHNIIENNTIEYNKGQGIINQWGSGTSTEGNVGIPSINNTYRNNVLLNGSSFTATTDSLVVNNTVSGTAKIVSECEAYNNKFNLTTLQGTVKLHDNNMTKITVLSSNSGVIDDYNITNNNVYGDVVFTAASSSLSTENITVTGNNIKGNITVTGTSGTVSNIYINKNIINGSIVLGPKSNQKVNNATIINNTVNSPNTYAVTLSKRATNVAVTDNILYAKELAGDEAVSNNGESNIVSNNKPTTLTITDDTYNNYFDSEGVFNYTDPVSKVVLSGKFVNNHIFTFSGQEILLTGTDDTILYNATITSKDNSKLTIKDLTINNTDTDSRNAIILNSKGNTIDNVKIVKNTTTGKAQLVIINGDNNKVVNSNITVIGPSDSVDYFSDPSIAPTVNIIVSSNNNIIDNNYLYIYASTASGYGTIEAITVQAPSGVKLTNNTITNNIITGSGTDYLYGINMGGYVYNNTLDGNNINITSNTYANGIQFFQSPACNNTITNNIIDVTAGYSEGQVTYGIIFSSWNDGNFENNRIHNNTIYVKGNETYGIEIFAYPYGSSSVVKNTTISNNTIISNGTYASGIALMSNDYNITGNTIIVTGTTNATRLASADWIKPTTSGMILQQVKDVTITDNKINVTTGPGFRILDSSSNINITNNTVYTTQGLGDKSVLIVSGTNVKVEDNLPIETHNTTITIDGNLELYKQNTITITVTPDNNDKIDSIVTVTIGDTTQNVTITNGTGTITYTPTSNDDVTITATFPGTKKYLNSTATKTLTVQDTRKNTNIAIDGNLELYKQNTITITVTADDNTNIDGVTTVTIGDTTQNVTITNGKCTVTYTPTSMDDVTITATYPETTTYKTSTTTKTLTVQDTRPTPSISVDQANYTTLLNTPIEISGEIREDDTPITATVNILVDGTPVTTVNAVNGRYTYTYTPATVGDHIITVTYDGNQTLKPSEKTTTVTATPYKTTSTTVQNMTITSSATTVNVRVSDENGDTVTSGAVIILVNGNTYTANIENGIASATIPATSLRNSNNILSINYNGSIGYDPSTTTYYTNGTKYGPVYYVAVNGSSSNDGRTPETPWNYTYAFDTIRNTDYNNSLIYILNGNYRINNTVSFNNGLTLKVVGNNTVLNGYNKKINGFIIQNGLISIEDMTFIGFKNTPIVNRAPNTIIIGNTFLNNKGTNGGAISNYNANNALINNNVFQNNTASYGGAVYNRGNNTIINNNKFTGNNATLSSGAIYNLGVNTKVTNNQFTNNTAKTLGGAINNWDTKNTVITDNKFNGNKANYGGSIYYRGSTLKLNKNNMTNNTALVSGGAVFVIGQNNNVTSNNFTSNTAKNGAAINNLGTNIIIKSNTMQYNTATSLGGAISNWNAKNIAITGNRIHDNQAQYGAIYLRGSNITIQSNNIYNNKVTSSGGAIYNIGANNTITRNTIRNNNAKSYGGAINNYNAVNTKITNNNLTSNNASYGGAIYTRAINTTITGNTITSNTATSGGAIFDMKHNTSTIKNNTIRNNPSQNGKEIVYKA